MHSLNWIGFVRPVKAGKVCIADLILASRVSPWYKDDTTEIIFGSKLCYRPLVTGPETALNVVSDQIHENQVGCVVS